MPEQINQLEGRDEPVQAPAQPTDTFNRQALREWARTRIDGLVGRIILYPLGAAIGAVFVPAAWVALSVGLIAVAVFAEHRAAKALLVADRPGTDAIDPPRVNTVVAPHIAVSIAVAFAVAIIWGFTGPDAKILPISLLAIAAGDAVLTGHQVLRLMIVRQILLMGTAVVMTLRDILLDDGVTPHALGTELLSVLLLAVAVLTASYTRARAYRDQFHREHELADARDAAERANAKKSNFIATVSHELRTQLNGVLGMAQTLLTTNLTDEQRNQAEVIAESGRSMNILLNDILDYAKLEAGKLAIDPVIENLRGAVDHIARLFGPLAAEKGLEFQATIGSEIPARLVFDPVRVRQCLSNLISNAIKFTKSGSVRITVSGEASGPGPDGVARYLITIVVADTGIGIPSESQAHLFQPFSQAGKGIARRFGGTGLGLSISRQLAESMGGSVTLKSSSDQGSAFRLTFAADQAQNTDHDQPGDDQPPALIDRRVLIADDIESNRMVMRLFLKPLGVQVVEVADGLAALEALARSRFDAALLDLNMPGMGGAEVAARVRLGEAGRADLPLLAISADSVLASVDTGPDGFDAVVVKPIDLRLLQSTLAGAIQRRKPVNPSEPGAEAETGGDGGG